MESQTVTIQVDATTAEILRSLQERATAEGTTLDVLLRPLVENAGAYQVEAPPEKQGRTWADVIDELGAMPSDDYGPIDLSTNKKQMEGYGEW